MRAFKNNIFNYLTPTLLVILFSTFFEYCYLYILLNGMIPKFVILFFLIPLYIFNKKIIEYISAELNKYKKIHKKIIHIIIILLLSLFVIKSFNIRVVLSSESILKIPANIGLILLGFYNVFTLTIIIDKINFKSQKSSSKKYNIFIYAIPSAIIFTFIYLVYFPGQITADSVYVWTKVGKNEFNDLHPLMYMLLIKGLRLIWDNIAVVSLFQIILCTFTFAFIANEFDKMKGPKWLCWSIALLLPIIPINMLYSVTIWKDVPYTMGLLILSILIYKSVTTNYYSTKNALPQMIAVSLFVLFMRHNALISVFIPLFILGIFWIVKKNKKLILKTIILSISLFLLFYGIKAGATFMLGNNIEEQSLVSSKTFTSIPRQQIIYTQHINVDVFTQQENETFQKFIDVDGLNNHKIEYPETMWMYYHENSINHEYLNEHQIEFWKYYISLIKKYPKDMMIGYEKITSILWASTDYGPTAYRGKGEILMEGLETIIEKPIIKYTAFKLDTSIFYHRYSNVFSDMLWRPAFAFILILLFLFVGYRKRGIGIIFLALPAIINQLSYFMIIASQDVRYVFINFSILIIIIALTITNKATKLS